MQSTFEGVEWVLCSGGATLCLTDVTLRRCNTVPH
eukprot:gene18145-5743_t